MKALAGLLLVACPAMAHVMSMSSGDLTIRSTAGHYQFRLPLYEVPQAPDPAQALFAHIAFASGGQAARLVGSGCRAETASGSYVCDGDYRFAAPVDSLDLECSFAAVTSPTHVHLLRVDNDGKHDQAIFDSSFPRATLRFRPPTALETAAAQTGEGAFRALSGTAQILFLVALVLAARGGRELLLLTSMFLVGQVLTGTIVPLTNWQPAVRFVEAAAGLTIAYLALEILVLPKAGMRWLIVTVLGAFHGLYFVLFVRTTGYRPVFVWSGAVSAEIAVIAGCALVMSYLARKLASLRVVPVFASILLVSGLVWFGLRLSG